MSRVDLHVACIASASGAGTGGDFSGALGNEGTVAYSGVLSFSSTCASSSSVISSFRLSVTIGVIVLVLVVS